MESLHKPGLQPEGRFSRVVVLWGLTKGPDAVSFINFMLLCRGHL